MFATKFTNKNYFTWNITKVMKMNKYVDICILTVFNTMNQSIRRDVIYIQCAYRNLFI